MKEKSLKYFTVTALVIVGLLQLIWILHTYNLQKRDIGMKVDEIFFEAAERELYSRYNEVLKKIPEGEELDFGTISEEGQKTDDFVLFQELFSRYGSEISFTNLDSIFNVLLVNNDIGLQTSTYLIQTDSLETNDLLQKSKGAIGAIKTDLIPIRKDGTLYIQAALSSPFKIIFTRMALLLAGTLIMMLFVGYCIIVQIRIIIRQNRIAQLRQDFSYAMIHDMKTPLTSIMVGTRVLESGKLDKSSDKRKMYFQIIKDEIDHLLGLANKVLTIAKLESKEIALEKQVIAIKPMLVDLKEKFSVKAVKEVEFVICISAESVYADTEYLKEAISNLIDNAIKYSGQKVRIEITCEENEDYSRIKVKDNGLGISLKDQSLIFEKFERGSATRRSSKGGATGFGLGLNYVQQVTQAHHGFIEIESIEGEYSEFTINLPLLMEELT